MRLAWQRRSWKSVNTSRGGLGHGRRMSTNPQGGTPSATLIIAAVCLLGGCAGAHAADAPLVLEHLTTADGLPQGTVFATLQDSQGFVWLATEDGLVRYDGHELFRYAYSRSSRDGLPGNYIRTIVEDGHHDLWIAIKDGGLARWQRATDSFTVYRHDPNNAGSLASDAVHAVVVDGANRVWVGTTNAGIDILEPSSGRIEHLRHDPNDPSSLIDDRIFTLALDRSGALWVGTEVGLDRWQPEHRAFIHFRHEAGNARSLSGNQVSRLLEDHSGALWVGTFDAGLDRVDRNGQATQVFRHDAAQAASPDIDAITGRHNAIGDARVMSLRQDHQGALWIGTRESGLRRLSPDGRLQFIAVKPGDPRSLSAAGIMTIFEARNGAIWIGTHGGGSDLLD